MRRPLTVATAKAPIDELIDDDRQLTHLVFGYLAGAAGWLLFGTLVGLYLSLKFIWPDIDGASWLSFGRLSVALVEHAEVPRTVQGRRSPGRPGNRGSRTAGIRAARGEGRRDAARSPTYRMSYSKQRGAVEGGG